MYLNNEDKINTVSDISFDDFFSQYMRKNKPCIFTSSLTEKWRSRKDWVTIDGKPNLNFLELEFGDSIVPVADCNVREYNSQHKEDMPLKEYISYWKNHNLSPSSSKASLLYLKDWLFNRAHPSYEAYERPKYFAFDWLNQFYGDGNDNYEFVYMGPSGTWTPFHSDVFGSYSWSANVCGRKRWIIYPAGNEKYLMDKSGKLPFSVEDSASFSDVAHIDVIQEPGEIVFVPSGWHHQVWNLEDTISINHNWFNACNVLFIWENLLKAALEVEKEISDCKDSEDWEDQCQVLLKAHHGMNFKEFAELLSHILELRLLSMQSVQDCNSAFYMTFDCKSIQEVCVKMLDRKLPKNVNDIICSLQLTALDILSKINL